MSNTKLTYPVLMRRTLLINSVFLLFCIFVIGAETVLNPLDSICNTSPKSPPVANRIYQVDTTTKTIYEQNVTANKYKITLRVNTIDRTYEGNLDIDFDLHEETDNLVLDVNIDDIFFLKLIHIHDGKDIYKEIHSTIRNREYPSEKFYIYFENPLKLGTYKLELNYTGVLIDDITIPGFYIKPNEYMFTNVDYDKKHYIIPFLHERNLRAVFSADITIKNYFSSVFTIHSFTKGVSERQSIYIQQKRTLPSFGFAITNLSNRVIEHEHGWYLHARASYIESHCIIYATNTARKILNRLNNYFPLLKIPLQIIIIPDGEILRNFNGLIIFSESYICDRTDTDLTHELAFAILDQIFGHALTNSYDTKEGWWFFEGVQLFFYNFIINTFENPIIDVNVNDQIYLDIFNSYRKVITNQTEDLNAIKSSLIFRMLETSIESSAKYLAELFSNIINNDNNIGAPIQQTIDLIQTKIERILQDDYKGTKHPMGNWVQHSGFPIVTIEWIGETWKISQEPITDLYEIHNTDDKLKLNQTWWIPITLRTNLDNEYITFDPDIYLKENQSVTLESYNRTVTSWLIANIQQTGYYRVNYDERNWRRITTFLLDDENYKKIHVINRAKLIDDAAHLADAGILDYDILFGLMCYLHKETELLPWKTALNAVEFLEFKLLDDPSTYRKFMLFKKALFDDFYQKYGYDQKKIEPEEKFKFAIEIGCKLNISNCVSKTLEKFNEWKLAKDINKKLHKNERKAIICSAMQHDPTAEGGFLIDDYSTLGFKQIFELTECFGYVKSRKRVTTYLENAFAEVDCIYFTMAVKSLLLHINGLSEVLRYFEHNTVTIKSRMHTSWYELLLFISRCINDEETEIRFYRIVEHFDLEDEQQTALTHIIDYNKDWKSKYLSMITYRLSHLQIFYMKTKALWQKHGLN